MLVLLFLAALPAFADTATASLMTKILIFGLLAVSLDLVFGFGGLWSFCHAAIFGVAAYTTGILIRQFGVTTFWLTAPAGIVAAGLASAIIGFLALRSSGIYFLLITFALGQLVYSVAYKWAPMTGGSDGLSGIPYPDVGFTLSTNGFYYFTLFICAICCYAMYRLTMSPFGQALQGVRESDVRMRVLGYNTWFCKYAAFILSGMFSGVAGVLYVHFNGFISPESVGMAASGLATIMVIIGGAGTLWGGLVGSAVIFALEYLVSIITAERWPMFLGGFFIAAVMLFRGGIFPYIERLWKRIGANGRP